jgi:hypothetical protein
VKGLAILWTSVLVLVAALMIQNFPPSFAEIHVLNSLHNFLPAPILYSYKWHRIIPVSISGLALIFLWLITKQISGSNWSMLMMAISPWFVKLALFDLAGITLLAFVLLAIFGWVKSQKVVITIGLVGSLLLLWSYRTMDKYPVEQAKFDVDQRVREETKINNYLDIIPLKIKRISYNKWYFEYLNYVPRFFNILNWDKLVSPSEQGTTVARSLWGETGISSLFFWQILLAILGLFTLKNLPKKQGR